MLALSVMLADELEGVIQRLDGGFERPLHRAATQPQLGDVPFDLVEPEGAGGRDLRRRLDALVADENPNEMGDGLEGMTLAEAQYDGRDAEASPTRGVFASVQVYGAHPFLLSAYTYAGAQGRLAGYWSPFNNPYLVIAVVTADCEIFK